MDVTEPIIKAALITLGQAYPRSFTFEGLFRAASDLAQTRGGQQDTLLNALLALTVNGLLELHAEPVAFAGAREPRPQAFTVARYQASTGILVVTNGRHEQVTLNVFQVALLELLDGKRDLAALTDALTAKCLAGGINLHQDGRQINSPEGLGVLMPRLIAENLRLLEIASLLI